MKEIDEIYNGPRRHKPIETESFGTDTDEAFRFGRVLYGEGRSRGYVTACGRNKSKAWLAALRKGYAYAKKRDGEPLRVGARRVQH
jgi:hypothetical protein